MVTRLPNLNPPSTDWNRLRGDLMGDHADPTASDAAAAGASWQAGGPPAAPGRPAPPPAPLPGELLDRYPAVTRLCEKYLEQRRSLVQRGRMQRVLLAAFIATIGVLLFYEANQANVSTLSVRLAVGVAGLIGGLGVVLQAMRTPRHIVSLQRLNGDRLLRGLTVAGAPPDEIAGIARRGASEVFEQIAVEASRRSASAAHA